VNGTPGELWERLRQAGVVEGELPGGSGIPSPWYVRVMLGLSGWIAALFLLGFVALGLEFVRDSAPASLSSGAIALVTAHLLFRQGGGDFPGQFALAVSLSGQALALYGLAELLELRDSAIWWAAAALQAGIVLAMPDFIQRVVAAWLAAGALSIALALHGAPHAAMVPVALAVALIWLNEFHWQRWSALLRPAGYGLSLALVELEGEMLFGPGGGLFGARHQGPAPHLPPWVAELAIALLLVAVVARLLARHGEPWNSPRMLAALLLTTATAAVSLAAPGIATGLMVTLLGFANGNRVLTGLGVAALLCYISAYYYTLDTTLLVKSQILAATGVTLLAARRVVLTRLLPATEEPRA
jgi:hypothetical protein